MNVSMCGMQPTKNPNELAEIIKHGGVALMQVDTVYGLICDGLNEKAVNKIKQIKNRTKPAFGFFVKNIQIAKKYAIMSSLQQLCFERVFPGYFTLIFKATELAITTLPKNSLGLIDNFFTIGLRVPNSRFCLDVLHFFDTPLVATSANLSGKPTAQCIDDIDVSIINAVDAIYYDKTKTMPYVGSTIIDITNPNICKIIRQGSGKIDELKGLITIE